MNLIKLKDALHVYKERTEMSNPIYTGNPTGQYTLAFISNLYSTEEGISDVLPFKLRRVQIAQELYNQYIMGIKRGKDKGQKNIIISDVPITDFAQILADLGVGSCISETKRFMSAYLTKLDILCDVPVYLYNNITYLYLDPCTLAHNNIRFYKATSSYNIIKLPTAHFTGQHLYQSYKDYFISN